MDALPLIINILLGLVVAGVFTFIALINKKASKWTLGFVGRVFYFSFAFFILSILKNLIVDVMAELFLLLSSYSNYFSLIALGRQAAFLYALLMTAFCIIYPYFISLLSFVRKNKKSDGGSADKSHDFAHAKLAFIRRGTADKPQFNFIS